MSSSDIHPPATAADFVRQQLAAGKQANGLLAEKSPYLLQHAFNPVHWLPWGPEAFALAEKKERPLFLSIGYSTCHWCHVMAHESFEDEKVAAFLNEHFICIKLDREERPDLDQIYMAATQAMNGHGGWPMSLFLLADQKPFFAGTYFPPESRQGRPGFLDLLRSIHRLWQEERHRLFDAAQHLTHSLQAQAKGQEECRLSDHLLHLLFQQASQRYDGEWGGFGMAPKFPRPALFQPLLRYYSWQKTTQARDMVLATLERMASGGIYDQVGGGFHRYSVDGQWRVPHFEKMLYDQAQLAHSYFVASQLSDASFFSEIGQETLGYVLTHLRSEQGGFFSAEDADSAAADGSGQHGEGLFYLWNHDEIMTLAGPEEGSLFCFLYGVRPQGNALEDPLGEFGRGNILYQAHGVAEVAEKFGCESAQVHDALERVTNRLRQHRAERPKPHLDDKIITAWNGLMISALSKGFQVTGNKGYLQAARQALHFIEAHLYEGKSLKRRYRDGEAAFAGQLDDYAFVVQGCLDLYESAFDISCLQLAEDLTLQQISLFADGAGGFFDSADPTALLRMKNDYDGAEPSGNGVSAMNLLRLAAMTGKALFQAEAEKLFVAFSKGLAEQPEARPCLAAAYDFWQQGVQQIVIAGTAGALDTEALQQVIFRFYLPNTVLLLADGGPGQAFLAATQPAINVSPVLGQATAYICQHCSCLPPITRPNELARLLRG